MPEGLTWRSRFVRFLRGGNLPVRARDEEALFEQVERDLLPKGAEHLPVTRESLARLAEEKGHDYAAAFFYLKTLRSRVPGRAARERIERILIVPGAFYRTLPEYNTDGLLGFETAERFGLPVERATVPEFAPVEECAELLRAKLEALPKRGTLIITISKGTSDLLVALKRHPELRERLSGWISIGGLARGTFSADEMLSRGFLSRALLAFSAWIHGGSLKTVHSLRAGKGSLMEDLGAGLALEFPVISIIPVPLHSHVTTFLRRRFVSLQKYGPNDGMSLLADSVIPGSRAIPVWGADHFFQVPGFSRYLIEALRELLNRPLAVSPLKHSSAPQPGFAAD